MNELQRLLTPKTLLLLLLASVFLASPAPSPAQTTGDPFKMVVHRSNRVGELSREEVYRLFLKKSTIWGDGQTAEPVDLAPDDEMRQLFSESILGKDVPNVQSYWQRMIFSGRATPPPAMDSERELLDYVATHPYAIGYVSAGTALGPNVRTVRLTD
jgi:ABC-type phosphate transport system substrate-binding protein